LHSAAAVPQTRRARTARVRRPRIRRRTVGAPECPRVTRRAGARLRLRSPAEHDSLCDDAARRARRCGDRRHDELGRGATDAAPRLARSPDARGLRALRPHEAAVWRENRGLRLASRGSVAFRNHLEAAVSDREKPRRAECRSPASVMRPSRSVISYLVVRNDIMKS
jgi:hypothetical protein